MCPVESDETERVYSIVRVPIVIRWERTVARSPVDAGTESTQSVEEEARSDQGWISLA